MFPNPPLETKKVDETIVTTMSGPVRQELCVQLMRVEAALNVLKRRNCVTEAVQAAVDAVPALRARLLSDPRDTTPEALRNCDELLAEYQRFQQPQAS
jgi:hypothetical protein